MILGFKTREECLNALFGTPKCIKGTIESLETKLVDELETYFLKIRGKEAIFEGILDGCKGLGRVKVGDRVRLIYLDKNQEKFEIRSVSRIVVKPKEVKQVELKN